MSLSIFKTITEYAKEIMENKNVPTKLADIHLEIAAKYAFLSDIYKDVQIEKAQFWVIKEAGDKPLSDTAVEAKWRQTEGGLKELRLKYEMRGLEKLMSAIKSSIVVSSFETKNMF